MKQLRLTVDSIKLWRQVLSDSYAGLSDDNKRMVKAESGGVIDVWIRGLTSPTVIQLIEVLELIERVKCDE
jgi:hypothetical protein